MDRIVGNSAVRQKLCLDILSDKLAHAFILEGTRGTGKHTIAMNVAAALACTRKDMGVSVPCGECPDCKKVLGGKSPDVIFVGCNGKATMGVDSVRFLKEDVRTVPNDLEFKVYIIEDADKMTVQAQNAFLLTLEEPPSYVRFILLCESADLLLETIRSRAPVMRTEPIQNDELDTYLCKTDRRAAQMKLTAPSEYAELIICAKHGIGTALEYLEPKKFAPIKEMRFFIKEFCNTATSGMGAKGALPLIAKFSQKREVLSVQLEMLSTAVNDLMRLKKSDGAQTDFFEDRAFAAELCDRVSMSALYTLAIAVSTASDNIKRNSNVRLTLIKMISDAGMI